MIRLTREEKDRIIDRIQSERHNIDKFPEEYQQMNRLVNEFKKDIKFRRACENRDDARKYARSRNLILGPDEDIDGIPGNDIVLYDYKGNPVVINGYELTKSEKPYRQKFREMYPTRKARAEIDGYSGFKKSIHGSAELEQWMEGLDDKYARIKKVKPRGSSSNTLYHTYCNNVRDGVLAALDGICAGRSHLKSILPHFSFLPLLYIDTVMKTLWNHEANKEAVDAICEKYTGEDAGDNMNRFVAFKKYINKHRETISGQLEELWREITINSTAEENVKRAAFGNMSPEAIEQLFREIPTDAQVDAWKRSGDKQALHNLRVYKAAWAEEIKKYSDAFKTNIINYVFEGRNEADIGESEEYIRRINNTIRSMIAMSKNDRRKFIYDNVFKRNNGRMIGDTHDYIVNILKDPSLQPIIEDINYVARR
jgi:hypothetical protein